MLVDCFFYITDDVYIDVKILSWGSINGGAFSYERSTFKPQPTLSNFDSVTKKYYDGSFELTAPTSNSTGLFTFESSNLAVASISGTTVTITGIGDTTITAIQAADGTFSSKTITTATLAVIGTTVLTKNGKLSDTEKKNINKNGAIDTNHGLTKYGELKATKSN